MNMNMLTSTFVGVQIGGSAPRTIKEIRLTLFTITSGRIVFAVTIQFSHIIGETT